MGRAKEEPQKAYSVRITKQALKSVDQIIGYIGHIMDEPISSIRVGEQIFLAIDRIEKNPFAFRECEEIQTKNKMYRKAVCMSWLIIYRITSEEVVILDIIHSSRQAQRIRSVRKIK